MQSVNKQKNGPCRSRGAEFGSQENKADSIPAEQIGTGYQQHDSDAS